MTDEKTVYVSYYTCDCAEYFGYTSKYCDGEHREGARIPLSKIKEWIEENR